MVVQSLDDAVAPIQCSIVLDSADKSSDCSMSVKNSSQNGAKNASKDSPEKDSPPVQQRRSSSRIQAAAKRKAEEELKARRESEELAAKQKAEMELRASRESEAVAEKQMVEGELQAHSEVEAVEEESKGKESGKSSVKKNNNNKRGRNEDSVGEGEAVASSSKKKLKACSNREVKVYVEGRNDFHDKGASLKVKETIRLYNKHYLHFVQEEEKRCGKAKAEREAAKKARESAKKASKSKKGSPREGLQKKTHQRPDLKALTKMMENNEILYSEKQIGNVPGIEVGYQFYSRGEMVAVGFHSHWLNGIDYMGLSYGKACKTYEFPIATSIVISGMYEDDLDKAEDVVYTGQGGHNLTGNKRQIHDQKLERGNLALKNCIEPGVPVRVVRGIKNKAGKIYTYDGLYKVIKYWAEKGLSGFTVYKFLLRRLEGQPVLTTNQVYFAHGRVPQSLSEIRGLVCDDITGGQEKISIPATNLVDDPPVPPTGFTYCNSVKVAKNVKLPQDATGCNCKGICDDPTTCECAKRNGSDFPYVSQNGGRLVEAKDVVFECGPNCGCGPSCVNRTSQKGIKYRLEVYRTAKKGWAVRSWDFIPAGAPVCEYTGILARTEDMDSVLENNYIFEIDCLQTIKGLGARERRSQNVSFPSNLVDKCDDQGSESAPEFCIDAGSTGNIARFINHCCEPNLFVQCVLNTHHDLKFARVMLFAADNIPPLQELTYDYGYELDSVLDSDGKVKQMACYCGAQGCRKRLF